MAGLLLFLGTAGCGKHSDVPAETEQERARALSEMPVRQLRMVLRGYAGDWLGDSDASRGLPAPPAQKPVPWGARKIDLGSPDSIGAMGVREAIGKRRSRRDYSESPLTRDELSFLLWATQGVTHAGDEGEQKFRAAPSAGGRYPLETYLAVNHVDGIASGLYRYLPGEHRLLVLGEEADPGVALEEACYRQAMVGEAAVVFIWTAVPYRTEWKYAYISHKMIALEAGHICQNLYLAAESIGAGACALLSYHQPTLDRFLGVDGEDEFVIYLACVGRPASPAEPAGDNSESE